MQRSLLGRQFRQGLQYQQTAVRSSRNSESENCSTNARWAAEQCVQGLQVLEVAEELEKPCTHLGGQLLAKIQRIQLQMQGFNA